MAIDTSYFASDLVAMVSDLPATAYYGTQSWSCAVQQLTQEETLLISGNDTRAALSLLFPISAIAVAGTPAIQARIAVKMPGQAATANYEIVRRELMDDGIAMRLTVMADNRVV